MKSVIKLTWTDGQCRLTIPKLLVKEVDLTGINYVVLEKSNKNSIVIRRIIDDKTFKSDG